MAQRPSLASTGSVDSQSGRGSPASSLSNLTGALSKAAFASKRFTVRFLHYYYSIGEGRGKKGTP